MFEMEKLFMLLGVVETLLIGFLPMQLQVAWNWTLMATAEPILAKQVKGDVEVSSGTGKEIGWKGFHYGLPACSILEAEL